jgi:hypothetical protein
LEDRVLGNHEGIWRMHLRNPSLFIRMTFCSKFLQLALECYYSEKNLAMYFLCIGSSPGKVKGGSMYKMALMPDSKHSGI